MDGTECHNVKQSKPGSICHRLNVFPHMWKLDPSDKCTHKYIYFGSVWGDHEAGEGKRMLDSKIILNISSIYEYNVISYKLSNNCGAEQQKNRK
jgi:hypothetical protein